MSYVTCFHKNDVNKPRCSWSELLFFFGRILNVISLFYTRKDLKHICSRQRAQELRRVVLLDLARASAAHSNRP